MGKGGVGKTVTCAAIARRAARAGKRVLLAEVRAPRRLPSLFGLRAEQDGPLQLAPGIQWINFTPQAALETYAMRLLKLRAVYRAVFEQRAVRRFLRALPSLSELLMLGHLVHLIEEGPADLVVLDAPSTGPGALMLEVPQVIMRTVPEGPLRDGAEWIQRLLGDPARTTIHLVVLPEELPVSEAISLHHRLRDDLGLARGFVVANRCLPNPFPPGQHPAVDDEGSPMTEANAALIQAARSLRGRLNLQQVYLDRLQAGVDQAIIQLPEWNPGWNPGWNQGTFGTEAIEALADALQSAERGASWA